MHAAQGDARSTPARLLAGAEDALHGLGCLCLAAMAALITADVVGRSLFHTPVQVQFELTELYLMPAVATLSVSRAFRKRAHLSLEIFPEEALGRARVAVRVLVLALVLIISSLIAWMAARYSIAAWTRNDTYLGVRDWPMYVAYACVPLGFGVLSIRVVNEGVGCLRRKSAIDQEPREEEK